MLTRNDFVGRNIGGYNITAQIASSASSTVLLGERTHPDHQFVAIKWLHSTHIASFEGQESFFHEVRRIRRLQHPFIVPNLGAGIENSTPYLITEYASNGSLRQGMQAQSPWLQLVDNAITLVAQAGRALHHAHQHTIVHGNLKPENILLNGRGKAWLTDFRLSSLSTFNTRLLAAPMSAMKQEGLVPEFSVEDTVIVSKENDIYALASITYELLTGRKPYMTPSVNNPGLQYKLKVLIAPRRLNTAVPLHVEQTLLRALSKDPAPRYTNILDFLADLGSPLDLDDSVIELPASTLKIVVVSAQTAQAEPVFVGESAPIVAVTPSSTIPPYGAHEAVAAFAPASPMHHPMPATPFASAWAFSPETPMSDVASTPASSFSSVAPVPDAGSTPASVFASAISSIDTVPMPVPSASAFSTMAPDVSVANSEIPGDGLTFVTPTSVLTAPEGSGTSFASYNPAAYEQAYQVAPAFAPFSPVPERPAPSSSKLSKGRLLALLALLCLVVLVSVSGAWVFASSLLPTQQKDSQQQTPEPTQSTSLAIVATEIPTVAETPTQEPSPTPTATPVVTPTPKPTMKPTPTPTSEPVPAKGLSVNPSRLSKSTCSNSRGNYVCVVQLSLGAKSGSRVSWLAFSSGISATVKPSLGTISSGQTIRVTITISDACDSSGSIRFVTTEDDLSVPWKC